MDDGIVVEDGPPEQVLKDPRTERARQFLQMVSHR
jgi:polar amino acid transport system ATP-binding protein